MKRQELLKEVRETLSNAGFYVSELCSMRPIGFDLVARRDNSLLIIKVLTNINAISEEVADELRTLSMLLKGCPLLIGDKKGNENIEEDVVYDRFGVQAISNNTLKNHLLEGIPLEVYAAPGGLYVNLDNQKIKKFRKEQRLSLGSFARSLRVSRRTVQMYEEGMNASIEVAFRIEDLMGTNATVPIDILNKPIIKRRILKKSSDLRSKGFREFQKEIFSTLNKMGYRVIPMERAPFEAVSQDKKKILLTCVDRYDKKILKKAHVVSSISKITEKQAVLIIDKEIRKKNIEGTPIVLKNELKKTRGPEELLELILERLYENNK